MDTTLPQLAIVAPVIEGSEEDSESSSPSSLHRCSSPSASDSDVLRSILKCRPPPQKSALRFTSAIFCPRRHVRCVRQSGKRITFQDSIEVTEFSRAVGHDAVPADETELAIGLGRPVRKCLAPLAAKKKPRRRVEEHCYLPLELRAKLLAEVMGRKRSRKVIALHCKKTKQVIMWRKEANQDSKEPAELMPGSYQEAQERAWKVAAEARAAAAESDSLFAASSTMGSFALEVSTNLARVLPNKLEPKVVQTEADFKTLGFQKRKQQLSTTGTFMTRSMASRMASLQQAV